jgi:hypothetical protein
MNEAEFARLPKSEQAALVALWQNEWQSQGAPICDPGRSEAASAAVTHWTAAVLQQSLARPDVEGKQAPTDEERESLRNDNWK